MGKPRSICHRDINVPDSVPCEKPAFSQGSWEMGSCLLQRMNIWSWLWNSGKKIKTLGTPETAFPHAFSNLDISISAQKVIISLGRNCADLGFLQSVVFLLGWTACWNTTKITSEQDVPRASSRTEGEREEVAYNVCTSATEGKKTSVGEVENAPAMDASDNSPLQCPVSLCAPDRCECSLQQVVETRRTQWPTAAIWGKGPSCRSVSLVRLAKNFLVHIFLK